MRPIVVIGGGPAGAASAITLARRGIRVIVLEAKAFPRIKVCGEFISPVALPVLDQLIGMDALRMAGAKKVGEFVVEMTDRELCWRMPEAGWAISREVLDELLLNEARRAGAEVLQPERAVRVDYEEGGVVLRTAASGSIHASVVVHADGSGRHDPAGPVPNRRDALAFKCHYEPGGGVEGVRIRSCRGGYVGTVEVEGGLATCAMVVKARMVPAGPGGTRDGAIDDLFRSLNGSWGEGARVTPWRACGVQASGYVPPGDYRSFRVGNAAAAVEPIGGEGIGLALWAGATLGEMLTEGAAGGNAAELARAQRLFARAYRTRLRLRRPACRAAGEVLARPRVVRSVRRLVAARGLGLRVWWWGMGKTDRSVGRVGGVSDKRAGTKARPDPAL